MDKILLIPPTLHTLSSHKSTKVHLGDDYLCPTKILLFPGDIGEDLEAATNKVSKINDDLYKLKALIGHQGPLKAPGPNLESSQYSALIEWETGGKTYEPLSILAHIIQLHGHLIPREMALHILMVGKD